MPEKPLRALLLQLLAELDKTASAHVSAEEERLLAQLSRRLGPWNATQEALEQQARIARIHFDYALAGIIETDAQWRIRRVNPAALSITRRIPRLLRDTPLDALFSAPQPEIIARHLDLLREQGISHSEVLFEVADKEFLSINLSSIQADEALFIHYIDDVTADRRHARELAAASEAAAAANRAKDRFLANVSHEIRTPLNGIVGLTHLCLMSECDARQRDLLEKISRSGKTLQSILNDLLDFAKIESGKLQYEQSRFDLYEVLDDLAAITAHSAIGKPLEIAFGISPGLPRHLVGDRLRLSQILNNLLSNAVKFTPAGHVTLQIDCPQAASSAARPLIRFTVSDSGEGISDETLERLFQPFTQADSSTTRRFGGTGLGLVIARQLAQGMQGQLHVNSIFGRGSTFILELPLAPASSNGAMPEISLPLLALDSEQPRSREAIRSLISHLGGRLHEEGPRPAHAILLADLPSGYAIDRDSLAHLPGPQLLLTDAAEYIRLGALALARGDLEVLPRPLTPLALINALRKIRGDTPCATAVDLDIPDEFSGALIAVAEDIEINQQIMVGLLHKAGIEVMLASDGSQLLTSLQNAPRQPELIFMDVHMPVLDGFDATRQLRALDWRGPIIGLSAGISATEQKRCAEVGMNDFLAKPIDLDDLWGVLTRWLPPRAPAAAIPTAAPPLALDQASGERLAAAGIDFAAALPRFLGNYSSLLKAIAQFREQHAPAPEQLRQRLASADRDGLFKLCHGLKGAAAAIGATALEKYSSTLERQAHDDNPDAAHELIEAISKALEKLRKIHP